ncbi:MAG TPA: AraC family transcriptional regulator [Lacunisphaera sp.]|jgi:AraC-like DNA-binding protein
MKTPAPHPDGFAGQHLVVVPNPTQEAARKNPLLRGLFVTDAGYFPHAKDHYIARPKGTPTHLVIACLRGKGWVQCNSDERSVKAGDLIWLRANRPHAYGADSDDPWTIGWVHFTGEEVESWRNHLGLVGEGASLLGHVSADGIAALKLEQIYLELEHGYSVSELISTSIMLRSALSIAAQAVRIGNSAGSSVERITAVRNHMRENFAQPHRLQELASAAGLSVPHFCSLFRRQVGFAPIDFLIRQRVQRACKLLDTTDLSISLIAAEVGYEDAYYFSRCFRRILGYSPRTYRKITKG